MILVSSFFFFLIGTTAADEGWKTVKRGVKLDYDLEKAPLEIKTDSQVGSYELVIVYFYTAGEDEAGSVRLSFTTTVQYWLDRCSSTWNTLPTTLPSATEKVWRITLTKTSGIRLKIQCNGVEVMNVLPSDTYCGLSDWGTYWNRDVKKIQFLSSDTASDYYIPYAVKCRGLKATWTNTVADKTFPVTAGTEVTLSCKAGYQLTGDKTVTCTKDTEFKLSEEPECVGCTGLMTEWTSSIKTTTQFPVVPGTVITVGCSDSEALNKGSSDITCTSGRDFNYSVEPKCVIHCTDLKASWTNTVADKKFPVTEKTEVTLSCKAGYQLTGDKTVTCTKGTEFTFSEAPKCVGCTGLKTEWKGSIKTTTQFPVVPGTVVKVRCSNSEALNKGSSEVTCTSGTDFSRSKEPSCSKIVTYSADHYKSAGMTTFQTCPAGKDPNTDKATRDCSGFEVTNGKVKPSGRVSEHNAVTVWNWNFSNDCR